MKQELTIEESAKLIELGISRKQTSKIGFVPILPEVLKGNAQYARPWGWFPIFALAGILSILPRMIKGYHLNIDAITEGFTVGYVLWDDDEKWEAVISSFMPAGFFDRELINALYQLLTWCIKENHIPLKSNSDG